MKYLYFFLLLSTTFYAKSQVTANAGNDRLICINDTLKTTGTGLNAGDTGTYQWKDLNTNSVISNTSALTVKITSLTSKKYELTVNRTSNNVNYTDKDTFVLTVSPLPTFKYNGPSNRCYDDGCLNLTLNIFANAMQGNDTSKKFYNLRYFQRFKNPSWISGGPVGSAPYVYCPNKFMTSSQVPANGLRDTICYEYKDVNGCYNYECKSIRNHPNPLVHIKNGLFCQRIGLIGLDNLVDTPFNKSGGIQTFRCIKVPSGSGVDPNSIITTDASTPPKSYLDPGFPGENKKTGDYLVEYCFKNPSSGCQRCDTATITVIRLPEIEFDSIPVQCSNSSLLTLDSFVKDQYTGKRITGTWQCVAYNGSRDLSNSDVKNAIDNGINSQVYFNPQVNAIGGQYLLKFTTTASGCPTSDSILIIVKGLPSVQINPPQPDSVCFKSGPYSLYSNYSPNDSNGQWTGEGVKNGQFNSDLVVMGGVGSKQVKVTFTYKSPITGCSDAKSAFITVINRPAFKFVQSVKLNSKYLVSFYMTDSNMNLNNLNWLWNFGNGTKSNTKYPKDISYTDSGNYRVILTLTNGYCITTDSINFLLNDRASSVQDIIRSIHTYPNPATSEIFINSPISGQLKICDIKGQLLLIDEIQSDETKRLNIENLSNGLYLLTINNGEAVYRLKLIKQ